MRNEIDFGTTSVKGKQQHFTHLVLHERGSDGLQTSKRDLLVLKKNEKMRILEKNDHH